MKRFLKTRAGWYLDTQAISRLYEPEDGWGRAELADGGSAELAASDVQALLLEEQMQMSPAVFGWEVVFAFADGTYTKAPIVAWRVGGSCAQPVVTVLPPEAPHSQVVHNSQSGQAFSEGSRGAQPLDDAIAKGIALARERAPKAAE